MSSDSDYQPGKFIKGILNLLEDKQVALGLTHAAVKKLQQAILEYSEDYNLNKPEIKPFDGITFPTGKFAGEDIAMVAKYNESYCRFLLSKSYVDAEVKAVIKKHIQG